MTANNRPPRGTPTDRDAAAGGGEPARPQTRPRMRAPEPVIEELDSHPLDGDADELGGTGVVSAIQPTRSIPPESLKKPFASLTPQQVKPSGPPVPPSQLFAETASMRPPQAPVAPGRTPSSDRGRTNPAARPTDRGRTTAPRPPETTDRSTAGRRMESAGPKRPDSQKVAPARVAKNGTCRNHGTALSPEGACVLCARDEAKRRSERSMRWIVTLLALAVLGGAAIALNTLR